jgi:hypothetical protein
MTNWEEADAKPALLADAEALATKPEHSGRTVACGAGERIDREGDVIRPEKSAFK